MAEHDHTPPAPGSGTSSGGSGAAVAASGGGTYPSAYPVWSTKFDYTTVVYAEHINTMQSELIDGVQRTLGATPHISRHDPGGSSGQADQPPVVDWIGGCPASAVAKIIAILDDAGAPRHGYNQAKVLTALKAAWSSWGGSAYPTGDPARLATWISRADRALLRQLTAALAALPLGGALRRSDVSRLLGADASLPPVAQGTVLPVNPRNHGTVSSRLSYQGRGLHIPYYRGSALKVAVREGTWMKPTLRGYDDPYKMASGAGLRLNQDGLWRIEIKADHSPVGGSVASGSARVLRLEVDGKDVGLRDYLDDDADTSRESITAMTWTEEFKAGTQLTLGMRVEGVPVDYEIFANVYLRAYLIRTTEGTFDFGYFPPPPPPPPTAPPKVEGSVRGSLPPAPAEPVKPGYQPPINVWQGSGGSSIVHKDQIVVIDNGPSAGSTRVQVMTPSGWSSVLWPTAW
ncbi:hypothetical protein ACWDTT_10525 [Streptosporangium sandarakinum]